MQSSMTFWCSRKCVAKCCVGMRGLYEQVKLTPVRSATDRDGVCGIDHHPDFDSVHGPAHVATDGDPRASGARETRLLSVSPHVRRGTASPDHPLTPRPHRETTAGQGGPAALREYQREPHPAGRATPRIAPACPV